MAVGGKILLLLCIVAVCIAVVCVCQEQEDSPCRQYKTHQVYSKAKQKCVSLVGGVCNTSIIEADNINQECVEGAICVKFGTERFSYCSCQSQYEENSERRCVLKYKDFCDETSGLKCSENKGLECQNGHCECVQDFHVYNAYSDSCLGAVGAFCLTSYRTCIGGARCYLNHNWVGLMDFETGLNGICLFMPSYEETVNRTCELKQETTFNSSTSTGNNVNRPSAFTHLMITIDVFVIVFIVMFNVLAYVWINNQNL